MSRQDREENPDPWVRLHRSQLQAMHEQATRDTTAQDAYQRRLGQDAGRDEGRAEALDEAARGVRDDKRAQQQIYRGLQEESARWADRDGKPGTRQRFGQPRAGDYQGGPVQFWPKSEREPEREAG